MRTLKKLWLVGILLAPVRLQTPAAEAQQCQLAYDFATFSEDVCASVCSQWGCNGYRFTGDACYCTHPTGGGGNPGGPEVDSHLLPPPASLSANPLTRGAAAPIPQDCRQPSADRTEPSSEGRGPSPQSTPVG
jgi:hypothetical protein